MLKNYAAMNDSGTQVYLLRDVWLGQRQKLFFYPMRSSTILQIKTVILDCLKLSTILVLDIGRLNINEFKERLTVANMPLATFVYYCLCSKFIYISMQLGLDGIFKIGK